MKERRIQRALRVKGELVKSKRELENCKKELEACKEAAKLDKVFYR